MHERAKKRMSYMEGYNGAFYNWWSYGEYFFERHFVHLGYHPNMDHYQGYHHAYRWIIDNLGPVRHLAHREMLWPRPIAADELVTRMLKELGKP